MGKEPKITRQQYKDIKRKNRQGMEGFFLRVWQDGYNEGVEAVRHSTISPTDIEVQIRDIKGIGEAKIRAIMQKIRQLYKEAEA